MTEFQKLIFQAGCKAFHSKTPDLLVNHTRMSVTVGEYGCIRITRDATGGFDVVGEEHEGKTQHFWVSDTNVVWGVKLDVPVEKVEPLTSDTAETKAALYESLGREVVKPMLEPRLQEELKTQIQNLVSADSEPQPVKKKAGRPKKNV